MQIQTVIKHKNFLPLFVLLGGLVPYLSSLIAEYGLGLRPCHLCLYQRYLYLAVAVVGLIMTLKNLKLLAVFAALLFIINASVAVYHSGVERGFVKGPDGCSGGLAQGSGIDDIRAQILSAELVRCDAPAIKILGLSMADVNIFMAFGLGAATLYFIRRRL